MEPLAKVLVSRNQAGVRSYICGDGACTVSAEDSGSCIVSLSHTEMRVS